MRDCAVRAIGSYGSRARFMARELEGLRAGTDPEDGLRKLIGKTLRKIR